LTCVREGHGLVLESVDLYKRTLAYIRRHGLVSKKNLDLCHRRTWTGIGEILVSNLDHIIVIVVLRIQIFTEQIYVMRKLSTCMRRGLAQI
jgi:hypothetical protein